MSRGSVTAMSLTLALLPALAGIAAAQGAGLHARVEVTPAVAHLGERVTYRAVLTGAPAGRLRVFAPASSADLTWGAALSRHREAGGRSTRADREGWYLILGPGDSVVVEVPLQVFRIGQVAIPGLRLQTQDPGGSRDLAFPVATVAVAPLVATDDTTADLRPLRGPLRAPWWERLPWRWIAAGVVALAVVVWLVRRLRRRPAKPVTAAPAPAARAPRNDPLTEGLAALAALRAARLPEAGRFAEHAYRLTLILRRFLERVEGTPRPGDTSPELVHRLEHGHLAPPDLERLAGLLSRWDRVKFARAPISPVEASQAEGAVEALMRRLGGRGEGKAA